jgi:hypothetical protein
MIPSASPVLVEMAQEIAYEADQEEESGANLP